MESTPLPNKGERERERARKQTVEGGHSLKPAGRGKARALVTCLPSLVTHDYQCYSSPKPEASIRSTVRNNEKEASQASLY